MPTPGGPPAQCSSPHDQADPSKLKRLNLGLGMGTFNSTIRFTGDREIDVKMTTASFSGSWLVSDKWTVSAGLGLILDGQMKSKTYANQDILPGATISVGAEYIMLTGGGYVPFIDFGTYLGFSSAQTKNTDTNGKTNYFASDLRFMSRAGWNVNGNIFPYLAARVFGGPVNWKIDNEPVTGSDIHHYQLAVGSAMHINHISLYAEWAGLGEQTLRAGISFNL